MGHLAQVRREKKTSMYFGSLVMSFESIMGFIKKLLSPSMVFNNSFGAKNCIIKVVNKIRKVRRVLTQKQ